MRYDTVCFLFWFICFKKLKITQFDCKTAFLSGTLDELIYMEQPERYNDKSGRACKLIQSLYGLKQEAR